LNFLLQDDYHPQQNKRSPKQKPIIKVVQEETDLLGKNVSFLDKSDSKLWGGYYGAISLNISKVLKWLGIT